MNRRNIVVALMLMLMTTPSVAGEVEIGPDRYAITLRYIDQRPISEAAAQRTLHRLADAALAVCGASDFSLRELRLAVRKSACWNDSMEDVVKRIDNPLLAKAWQMHRYNTRRLLR